VDSPAGASGAWAPAGEEEGASGGILESPSGGGGGGSSTGRMPALLFAGGGSLVLFAGGELAELAGGGSVLLPGGGLAAGEGEGEDELEGRGDGDGAGDGESEGGEGEGEGEAPGVATDTLVDPTMPSTAAARSRASRMLAGRHCCSSPVATLGFWAVSREMASARPATSDADMSAGTPTSTVKVTSTPAARRAPRSGARGDGGLAALQPHPPPPLAHPP
jgi:hypothetical protein